MSDLKSAIVEYGKVISICECLNESEVQYVVRVICEVYATKSATRLLTCMENLDVGGIENYSTKDGTITYPNPQIPLPSYAAFKAASERLFVALLSNETTDIVSALREMGVFDLCPDADRKFARLAERTERVTGRVQLIPLIELAMFSLDYGFYQKAETYAVAARKFRLTGSELHDLRTIEGAVALHRGDIAFATTCLSESIRACLTDEFACIDCSVRAPNMMLASKLLECGERTAVIEFLHRCCDVWDLYRPQFEAWLGVVESGGHSDLRCTGILGALSNAAVKLNKLCAIAPHFDEEPPYLPRKTATDALEARARLRAEFMASRAGGAGLTNR